MKKTVLGKAVNIEDDITVDTVYELAYPISTWSVQITPTGGNTNVAMSNDNINFINYYTTAPTASAFAFIGPVRYIKVLKGTSSTVKVSIRGC